MRLRFIARRRKIEGGREGERLAGCKNKGVCERKTQLTICTNLNVEAGVLGRERRRAEAAFQMLPLTDQSACDEEQVFVCRQMQIGGNLENFSNDG